MGPGWGPAVPLKNFFFNLEVISNLQKVAKIKIVQRTLYTL